MHLDQALFFTNIISEIYSIMLRFINEKMFYIFFIKIIKPG